MLSRSLISLCALAALAVQCATAKLVIPDGTYKILNREKGYLTSPGSGDRDAVHLVDKVEHGGSQWWKVKNTYGDLEITPVDTKYYLAPSFLGDLKRLDYIVQTEEEFTWSATYDYDEEAYRITPADTSKGLFLTAAGIGSNVVLDFWKPNERQQWDFVLVPEAELQPRAQCGPWRMPRQDFYL
jgi:hypothetical protein